MQLFGSFLRGMNAAEDRQRQQAADARALEELTYQRGRRTVMDGRDDQTWSEGREDREYEVGTVRPLREQSARLGLQSEELGVKQQEFGLQRAPAIAKQQDESHAVNLAGAKQGQAIAAEGASQRRKMFVFEEAEAKRAEPMKALMAEIGMNEATLMAETRKMKQTFNQAALQGAQALKLGGGEAASAKLAQDWFNNNVMNGVKVELQKGKDGAWYALPDHGGEPQKLGSIADVWAAGEVMLTPEVFAESVAANRRAASELQMTEAEARAKDPRKFVETVQTPMGLQRADLSTGVVKPFTDTLGAPAPVTNATGATGQQPAVLQEVDQVFARMMQMNPNADDAAVWMEAYNQVKTKNRTSPEQARAEFYRSTLSKMLANVGPGRNQAEQQAAAESAAERMTEAFSAKYLGGAAAQPAQPGQMGIQPRQAPTSGAAGSSQDNPADATSFSAKPPSGTWVRLPDGRVVQTN